MNQLNKEATHLYDAEEEQKKEKEKPLRMGGGRVISSVSAEPRRSGREVKKRDILDL